MKSVAFCFTLLWRLTCGVEPNNAVGQIELNNVVDQTSPSRYKPESFHFMKTVELEVTGQGAVAFEILPSHTRDNLNIFFRNKTNKMFEFQVANRNVVLQCSSNITSIFTLQNSQNFSSNLLSFDASSRWIWVSLCPYTYQLCFGQGYMVPANARYTFGSNLEDTETKRLLRDAFKDIKFIEIEGAELPSPPKRWKFPVKTKPMPSVVPRITLDQLNSATHLTPLQLPFKAQTLYGIVIGFSMTQDVIEMINYSLDTEGATLNRKLRQKSKTFTTDPSKMSYIRVTVGDTQGVAPGLPFVLEIWPKGHFSPVHNHADTVAVIKVLHGRVACKWYNPLANRSGEKPELIGSTKFIKDGVTWLNPEIFQTHQLHNEHYDTAAITIQAYSYMGHDTTRYETFDYVVDDKQNLQHFTPVSDFTYDQLMMSIERDCGNRTCLNNARNVVSSSLDWREAAYIRWAHNCDWNGGDIENVHVRGEGCGTKCLENPSCTRFTWTDYEGGTCWLKSGPANVENAIGNNNGVCGYRTAGGND